MTTDFEPTKKSKANKAHKVNPPHRLHGKDLEVFMNLFNHLKAKQEDIGDCMLWPQGMPKELRPTEGYSARLSKRYGVFQINEGPRMLTAHKAVYVNCHEANPEHKEVSVIDGKLDQIRHRYCKTPDREYIVDKTTFVEHGGNRGCVNPLHLVPGSQDANRIDLIASMVNQLAIDTINVRLSPQLWDDIASERMIAQLVAKKLKLNRKKLSFKSVNELLRDIVIVQIKTFGEIIYPDGERSFALEYASKAKPKNAA